MHRTGGTPRSDTAAAERRRKAVSDHQAFVLAVAATAGGLTALVAGQVVGEPAAAVVGALAFVSTASVCASGPRHRRAAS